MLPPASEVELQAFEDRWRVRLPADYRAFLSHVGNGGAGPHYGLDKLSCIHDYPRPDLVFPWTKAAFLDDPARMKLTPADSDCDVAAALDVLESMGMDDGIPGTVQLSEQGCGYTSFLVVNGPAHGTVWNNYRDAGCGLVPTKLSFAAWYREWLDRYLPRMVRAAIVELVREGMPVSRATEILGSGFEVKACEADVDLADEELVYEDLAISLFAMNGVVTRVERHHMI